MQTYAETTKKLAMQFPKNLISNILYFGINILIGVLLVPYFISTLGVAAYGLIPLAMAITGYVGIIVVSLNSAVSRYLTVDLQKEDYSSANLTFNTAIFGLSAIIVPMVPLILIVAFFIPEIFSVPSGYENDAIILFIGVCIAFMIRAWSGNFTVQLFAYNRIDFQNIVNITNLVVQTSLIIVFFEFFKPNLAFIGIAMTFSATVAAVLSIVMAKSVCPQLKFSPQSFDMTRLKMLTDMGGWVIITQIGALLFLQIDLIVVNKLFGATSAGEYAIVLNWGILLRSAAMMIASVLTPIVFTYYAKEHLETLVKMMKSSVKLMGMIMALPIGIICGFAPQILTVWVGAEYAFLAPLMVLLTLHLIINLSVQPLFDINIAYNKVRVPGIVTLLLGVLNFSLAILLPLLAGWGYYIVAATGAIVLTMKNAFFTPWYATRVMGVKPSTFTASMLPGIVITLGIIAVSLSIAYIFPIDSILSLGVVSGIETLFYVVIMWKFGLSRFEREIFGSFLPERIRVMLI